MCEAYPDDRELGSFILIDPLSQWKWRLAGRKNLHRQMQQHRRILADRIQHHRLAEFRRHLAQDDAFGFQPLQVVGGRGAHRITAQIGEVRHDLRA